MRRILPIIFFACVLHFSNFAQTPGIIYVPPGGMGVTPLNPNGDGWSSTITTGYTLNDITESDIPFQPLPVPYAEPTSDLVRGADCKFSDIVRIDSFDSGVYMYSDGTNLLFRFRQGSTTPGSKGYSILIDSDMLFGCCGPNADPNYIPKTTGTNGNPGFEIEIVLETNFQVAMYNVDGIDNPLVPDVVYPINSHHQRSVALTNNCDDPDYFHDFYIVLSDLYTTFGINANTPLRYAATTVMAPKPALGGPLSDINGGGSYEDIIFYQCGTPIGISPTSTEPCSCTNPPTINGPISSGTNIPITGNWSATSPTKPNEATIEVFVNGTSQGTTNATDGTGWGMTLPGPLVNGDTIYATAQATGEGVCDPDPQIIIVSDCNASNTPAAPIISCVGSKGIKGTTDPNATITISLLLAPPANPTENTLVSITADATGAWGWDGLSLTNNTVSNICTAGSGDMQEGTYNVVSQSANCPSIPASICLDRNGGSFPLSGAATAPTISTNPITEGSSDIEGTSTADDIIRLYINGFFIESTIATGGNYAFIGVSPLFSADNISITAQSNLSCESAAATSSVSCILEPPTINANINGEITAGTVLSGTSNEEGATVDIFNVAAPTASLGSTTVIGGSWTSTINAIVGTSYFATITTACGTSNASLEVTALNATGNRCGLFTNAPYNETSSTINGSLSSPVTNTLVNLYIDGALIASTTTSSTSWSIVVPSPELYGGGVLTIGIQEPGALELFCAIQEIVNCSPPPAFTYTPTAFTIASLGGTATFTLSSTTAGILYVIEDEALPNIDRGVSIFSQGTDFTLETFPFTQEGEYDLQLKGMSFSGDDCEIAYPVKITVLNPLPVELLNFEAALININDAQLAWQTSSETNNLGFEIEHATQTNLNFEKIGFIQGKGNSLAQQNYSFSVENLAEGMHYFRLKQLDFDAHFEYSNTVALSVDQSVSIEVFPTVLNQSNNTLQFKIPSAESYTIEIVSNLGILIKQFNIDPNQAGIYKKQLNIDYFSSGIYYVNIHSANYHFTRRIRIE